MKALIYLALMVSIILCIPMHCQAQAQPTVLFEHKTDSLPDKWGPNRKYYSSIAITIATSFGDKHEGLHTKFSFPVFVTAYKLKQKLSNTFSFTYQAGIKIRNYVLANDVSFPDAYLLGIAKKHAKERMNFVDANTEANLRINFDPKRGDILGNYLELGTYASYIPYNETVIKDKGPGSLIIKTHYIYPPYINPFEYGFQARLGHNNLALECSYRASNLFYSSYHAPEITRLIFGIHLGL